MNLLTFISIFYDLNNPIEDIPFYVLSKMNFLYFAPSYVF